MRSHSRSGLTLAHLLVLVGILLLTAGVLLPAIRNVRMSADRMRCQNNMKQLALAVHVALSQNGKFPDLVSSSSVEGSGTL